MKGTSIVVMGVMGSGKSTIGVALANALNAKFIDGDDLHPKANILKMAAGTPLNDDDRAPWLERISDAAFSIGHKNEVGVIVCSALKKRYRDQIRNGNHKVRFVYLEGTEPLLADRLSHRQGHFMKLDMLRSQLSTLEHPQDDEKDVITIAIDATVNDIVTSALKQLQIT